MISIIIPSIGRQSLINCLNSIQSQLNPPEYEVIVVANYLEQWLMDELQKYNFVKYIEYTGKGNGPAKNHAVMFAKGEFIVFTDDDCVVDRKWLNTLVLTQLGYNADIVVGQCSPCDTTNPYLVAHQGLIMYYLDKNPYVSGHEYLLPKQESNFISILFNKVEVGTSMNMLIRKSTFECLGGFSKEFTNHYGDDYDFNMRWKLDETVKAVYCKNAIVKHNHPLTLKSLIKLSFRYGMGLEVCRKLAVKYYEANTNLISPLCTPVEDYIKVHPSYSEYKYIRNYIAWQSFLLNECSTMVRWYASWLSIMALLIKRLGSWYGRRNPEVSSKIYDGV